MAPRKSLWLVPVLALTLLTLLANVPALGVSHAQPDPAGGFPGEGILDPPGGGGPGGGGDGGDPDDFANFFVPPSGPTVRCDGLEGRIKTGVVRIAPTSGLTLYRVLIWLHVGV